jgi:lysylphosphatidylglycerol synthetase-like protein (DUF2156 family)
VAEARRHYLVSEIAAAHEHWCWCSVSHSRPCGRPGIAGRHRAERTRVEELLHAHGDSSLASFALAPGTDHFFSANGRAMIAYHFESDTLLGIGGSHRPR